MKYVINELRCSIGGIFVVLGSIITYAGDEFISLGCLIAGIERSEDLIDD